MLSKFFANFHGSHSSSLAARAAIAGVGVVLCCGSFASAQVVYNDTFARTGTLAGTQPSPVDIGGASWTTNLYEISAPQTDGSSLAFSQTVGQYSIASAFLPFTPPSSGTVTLSGSLEVGAVTGSSTYGGWGLLGFEPNTSNGDGSQAGGPIVQLMGNGVVIIRPNMTAGSGTITKAISNFSHNTAYEFSIAYDLSTQTATWYLGTGSGQTNLYSYNYSVKSDAPIITAVEAGIWSTNVNTSPEIVHVQNFELSSTTPVPEPATLGLFAVAGAAAGLLMLKRRRA